MTNGSPLTLIELAGSRRTMGESFGEQLRPRVQELYAIRLQSALLQAHEHGRRDATEAALLAVARASFRITADFDPETADEIEGIARGSGLSVEQTMAMNGMTDLRDALSWWEGPPDLFGGCTAVVAQRDRTRDGELLAGQTWDLGTDNKPFVMAVRRAPSSGLRSVCLTTAGCLPFLGVNEAGVAVGTTNLRTRDARPGIVYLTLIDRALRAKSATEAIRSIGPSPRAGGHFFYVTDASRIAIALECTARRFHVTNVSSSVFVHTNHCLVDEPRSLDVDESNPSSHVRLRRMTLLAETSKGPLDPDALRSFFGDTSSGLFPSAATTSMGRARTRPPSFDRRSELSRHATAFRSGRLGSISKRDCRRGAGDRPGPDDGSRCPSRQRAAPYPQWPLRGGVGASREGPFAPLRAEPAGASCRARRVPPPERASSKLRATDEGEERPGALDETPYVGGVRP